VALGFHPVLVLKVILENSRESIPALVTDLSLQGCFLDISSTLRGKTALTSENRGLKRSLRSFG